MPKKPPLPCEILLTHELLADPVLLNRRTVHATNDLNVLIRLIAERTNADVTPILRLRGEPWLPNGVECTADHRDYATAIAQLEAAEAVLRAHNIPTPAEEAFAIRREFESKDPV